MRYRDTVPMYVLEPIIRDWFKRNGYVIDCKERNYQDNDKAGGVQTLSEMSGVSTRRIGAILAGGYNSDNGNVEFDTADKLLCAMNRVEAWQHELKPWYGPLRVAHYERDRDVPLLVAS